MKAEKNSGTAHSFFSWLWILAGCMFGVWLLGLADYGMGILISPTLYTRREIYDAFQAMFFAQGIFTILGIGLFLFLVVLSAIGFISKDKAPSIACGICAGTLFFFILPCLFYFPNDWMTGLGLAGLLLGSVLIGLSIYWLWERIGGDLKEKSFLNIFIWAGLISGLNFILLIFVSIAPTLKIRLIFLPLAGVIFLAIFGLGLFFLKKNIRWLRIVWMIFVGVFLIMPLFFQSSEKSDKNKGSARNPKNVILILADACRADALGIYGGENQTPNLDKLAQEGIWFKKTYSQASWTAPSVASIFSSQYPGVFRHSPSVFIIPSFFYLLAERFRNYGYYTYGLISNWVVCYRNGYLQGFDKVYLHHHKVRFHRLFGYLPAFLFWQRFALIYLHKRIFPDTCRILTDKAIEFLQSKKAQKPFFLYIHYMDPHDPYEPPKSYISHLNYKGFIHPPYGWGTADDIFHQELINKILRQKIDKDDEESKRYVKELYLAEVRHLDDEIARIIRTLRRQNLIDDTLVVFTADHGEEFWEHGDNQHGKTLYEELLKVPLIFWGAGLSHKEVDFPVELIDLTPTICGFIGIPTQPDDKGRNLWEIINSSQLPPTKPIFTEGGIGRYVYSVRKQNYKLIYQPEREKFELYDLSTDPLEKNNIYAPNLPEFLSLKEILFQWIDENKKLYQRGMEKQKLSPLEREAIKQRLRSLGYIK